MNANGVKGTASFQDIDIDLDCSDGSEHLLGKVQQESAKIQNGEDPHKR